MAASRDAIVMVEGGAKEVSEQVMVDALLFGHAAVKPLLDAQDALRKATATSRSARSTRRRTTSSCAPR